MKKFLTIVGLVASVALNSFGANAYSTNIVGGAGVLTNGVYYQPIYVSSITLACAAAQSVNFYDSTNGTLVVTNGNYTTRVGVSTNMTVKYTNSIGIIQTNTWTGIHTANSTVVAATNTAAVITSVAVPANVPVTLPVNLSLAYGLSCKLVNTNNITLTIVWSGTGLNP